MGEPNDLVEKATEWVNQQGYPLEFFVEHTLREAGLRTRQSFYVRAESEHPLEIDVVAFRDLRAEGEHVSLMSTCVVHECKFSSSIRLARALLSKAIRGPAILLDARSCRRRGEDTSRVGERRGAMTPANLHFARWTTG